MGGGSVFVGFGVVPRSPPSPVSAGRATTLNLIWTVDMERRDLTACGRVGLVIWRAQMLSGDQVACASSWAIIGYWYSRFTRLHAFLRTQTVVSMNVELYMCASKI